MSNNNLINSPFPLSTTKGGSGLSNPTAHSVLISEGSSPFSVVTLSTGDLLGGNTGADPIAYGIFGSTGISVDSSVAGTITISATSGFVWEVIPDASAEAEPGKGFIPENAGLTTITLPATVDVGAVFSVQGKSAAGWVLQANTGQTIHFGNVATSVAGSLASTLQYDNVQVLCITDNTTFAVLSSVGNLTVA